MIMMHETVFCYPASITSLLGIKRKVCIKYMYMDGCRILVAWVLSKALWLYFLRNSLLSIRFLKYLANCTILKTYRLLFIETIMLLNQYMEIPFGYAT